MFNQKKAPVKLDEIDTIIGAGTVFKGNIEATGIVRIDGEFKGEMNTSGDVILGEDANVSGSISARNIQVAGTCQSTVVVSQKLEIMPTGKVLGNVEVGSIVIQEGAVFKGECKMKNEIQEEE